MVSFNHYSFDSVGEFYYRYILGIQPLAPGFSKVRIAPVVDARLGSVAGSYQSRAGKITVAWQVENDRVSLQITTPVESEVVLPNGTVCTVDAGTYQYHLDR